MTQITVSRDFRPATKAGLADAAVLDPILDDVRARRRAAKLLAVRQGMLARQRRQRYFSSKLFGDPAWDILLELYAASLADRRMTVSRLVTAAGVPMTTTLRWINTLEQDGLLIRQDHPLDRRQVYLSLSEEGCRVMDSYFEDLLPDTKLL